MQHPKPIHTAIASVAWALTREDATDPDAQPSFDRARVLVMRAVFLLMAVQRGLVSDDIARQVYDKGGSNLSHVLADWAPGVALFGLSTDTDIDHAGVRHALHALAVEAQGVCWPSAWLGSMLNTIDAYARHHGDDGTQARILKRHNGAYYTEQRLVSIVVRHTLEPLVTNLTDERGITLLDPAAGGGIFLVEALHQLAARLQANGTTAPETCSREVLERCIYGVDIDPLAVMAARSTLWLEVGGCDPAILHSHIIAADSLLGALPVDVKNADIIVGNPPWNKIKADLKEFIGRYDPQVFGLQGTSLKRYIKEMFTHRPDLERRWTEHEAQVRAYVQRLQASEVYAHQVVCIEGRRSGGDPDLYKFFLERSLRLVRPGGRIGLLVPAALCTAEGAVGLRRLLLNGTRVDTLVTIENRDVIFPIDSRFKYAILIAERDGATTSIPSRFMLNGVSQADACLTQGDLLRLPRAVLETISPGHLTIPDVRTQRDIALLEKLHRRHPALGATLPDTWNVRFVRELDMTNDSELFQVGADLEASSYRRQGNSYVNVQGHTYVPLFEGRMIHQYDHAYKAYVSGHGRKAIWKELHWNDKSIVSHYYVSRETAATIPSSAVARAAFCDVTGQTNERTVLAALVPAGCVAGNKVPTVRMTGPGANDVRLHFLWLAIANSFTVDWLMRMRMSTTINFFHWFQIPFPRLTPTDEEARDLIAGAAYLSNVCIYETRDVYGNIQCSTVEYLTISHEQGSRLSAATRQHVRAGLDADVAAVYGITPIEYASILASFPLLDRRQPALPGDVDVDGNPRSYITRDLALLTYLRRCNQQPPENLVDFYREGSVDIETLTGKIRNLEDRVERALALGAVAYVPTGVSANISKRRDVVGVNTTW